MATAGPNAGLLPGPGLRSLLLTTSDVPTGYQPRAEAARDSGNVFAAPGPEVPPPGAVTGCPALLTTGFLSLTPGPGPASYAQNEYNDPYGQTITSEVDDYRGGDAATIMAGFRNRLADCTTFVNRADVSTPIWHLVAEPGPAIGDESVAFVVTSRTYLGGETGVVVRIGNVLVAAFESTTRDGDTGADARAAAATVAARVAALPRPRTA